MIADPAADPATPVLPPTGDTADRPGAFYGRRKGRPLRLGQGRVIDENLPALAVDLTKPAPVAIADLFGRSVSRVYMESGFGGGEHLLSMLEADADLGVIGAEPFVNGMAKLLMRVEEAGFGDRLRLHAADSVPLLDWLPDACLDRFYLLYPDPWPKTRHWKRRFVQRDTLDRIARVLKPGAEFRYASDWANYVDWTLEHVLAHPAFRWTATTSADWHRPWDGWHSTRYEQKALREGRTPAYFRFERL